MSHRKNINTSSLDLVKETLWNLVLYFIYFFTLLFWVQFIGLVNPVSAQGNRGVIINNQKFDDSSGNQYAARPHRTTTFKPPIFMSTTTTTQVIIISWKNRVEGYFHKNLISNIAKLYD